MFKGGFGTFVGPGQTEDQIQPVEAERISTTVSNLANAYPLDVATIRAGYASNPNARSMQPRAYANDYTLPEKVYQYTLSMQRELGDGFAASAAYVGAQGRNLFLRSVANRTVAVLSNGRRHASPVRHRDVRGRQDSRRDILPATSGPWNFSLSSVQRPFAEVIKTSGGHDSYNAMRWFLKRSTSGPSMNAQYTLGKSRGTPQGRTRRRPRPITHGPIEFDYDNGFQQSLTFVTTSTQRAYTIPQGALKGGWTVGGILNAQRPAGCPYSRPTLCMPTVGIY